MPDSLCRRVFQVQKFTLHCRLEERQRLEALRDAQAGVTAAAAPVPAAKGKPAKPDPKVLLNWTTVFGSCCPHCALHACHASAPFLPT